MFTGQLVYLRIISEKNLQAIQLLFTGSKNSSLFQMEALRVLWEVDASLLNLCHVYSVESGAVFGCGTLSDREYWKVLE
jgi:predicted lipoprotein